MSIDEASARRIVLAQAIETADAHGKLASEVERALIDREAKQAAQAGAGAGAGPVTAEHFLDLRAQRVLALVEGRDRTIASLRSGSPWRNSALAAVPLATALLGALTERIADPHRVDLLSLPLIGIVLWNVLAYLLTLGSWVLLGRARGRPAFDALRRWADAVREWRGRSGHLRADVIARFHLQWNTAAAPLHLQRWKALLHLAAFGWAAGIAASLLVQGLVVEYRVGWESTFLDAGQVRAVLHVLLAPVMWLFAFDPFTLQEIARLQLGPGDVGQVERRWVWMYVALLLLVVMVPRGLLAMYALWRAGRLARRVGLDLRTPYFQRIVSLLHPARVQLCLVTHRPEDRTALRRVLVQEPEATRQLIGSASGDALCFEELAGNEVPPAPDPATAGTSWLRRWARAVTRIGPAAGPGPSGNGRLEALREECHAVLHVVGAAPDLEAARALLQWLGKPVLVLVNRPGVPETTTPGLVARCRAQAAGFPLIAEVLSFDSFARCWVQEGVLLDAIGRCLPDAVAPGFERIASAWHARNGARFDRCMTAMAEHLLFAARQAGEVPGSSLSVKNLVVAGERQGQALARQGAMQAMTEALGRSAVSMFATLRALHGIDDAMADDLEEALAEKFVVHRSVDAPQAAIAGAAGGAATGVSVDLLTGGLTLGAATALGALVGAGAAFIGAAWKNRATPGGATVVQLSDEMMQALVEAALVRYLAVVHHGRAAAGASQIRPFWKAEVVAAVEARNAWLRPFWAAARAQPDADHTAALARELQTMTLEVLDTLYPGRARAAR